MVDDFKQYFVHITFEKIPRLDNRVANAMTTIASLLQIPNKQIHYDFLVERLFSPAYDNSASQVIYVLTGSNSPLYGTIYDYLKKILSLPAYLATKNAASSAKPPNH